MTSSEEKAKELYDKYLVLVRGGNLNETYHTKAKQCALISVDEILNLGAIWFDVELIGKGNLDITEEDTEEYWHQVKEAINKL